MGFGPDNEGKWPVEPVDPETEGWRKGVRFGCLLGIVASLFAALVFFWVRRSLGL